MGTVNLPLPADGSTANVADYNTPLTTLQNEFNGNIDNANISDTAAIAGSKLADGGITNAKLATTAGELGGAWQSWTPTWTNFTTGNGTLTYAKYTQVGKTVHFRLRFVLGSTSAVTGIIGFSLPVDTNSEYVAADIVTRNVQFLDGSAGTRVFGLSILGSSSRLDVFAEGVAGTYTGISSPSSIVPFTWASGDQIQVSGTYEAA